MLLQLLHPGSLWAPVPPTRPPAAVRAPPLRRTSTPEETRCAPGPRPPGRRASETSSGDPRGSQRRRTRGPWRWRTTKRLEAAGCQRPAGSPGRCRLRMRRTRTEDLD